MGAGENSKTSATKPGQRLVGGHYRLTERLGAGGMGVALPE
jgi:hypothetical protein